MPKLDAAPPISSYVKPYRDAFLRHDPRRFAVMLTPHEAAKRGEKYHDISGPVTDAMILRQLKGDQSYAVPVEENGLACYLPLDVDSGGLAAIVAILEECRRRRLWAFGQYTPRPGLSEGEQHGYVYVPTDLVNAQRLAVLGDELIAAVKGGAGAQSWKIENRAHGADTRLPMTRHKHTGQFGDLVLGHEVVRIDPNPLSALRRLFADYHENAADLLPPPPAPQPTRQQAEGTYTAGLGITIERYNQDTDIVSLLEQYGAKRVARTLYYCPFHDDKHASLGVYHRGDGLVCHCMSQHSDCPLAQRGSNDAFNVYCIGEQLSPEDALKKLNGITDPPERKGGGSGSSGTPQKDTGKREPSNHSSRGASAPQTGAQRVSAPSEEAVSTWQRDPELLAYIKAHGSSGVVILHKAREKLGELATNAQVNAEIERRRGSAYTARHLRYLNSERLHLIQEWRATQQEAATAQQSTQEDHAQGGENIPAPMHHKVHDKAYRGGDPTGKAQDATSLDAQNNPRDCGTSGRGPTRAAQLPEGDEKSSSCEDARRVDAGDVQPKQGRRKRKEQPRPFRALEARRRRVERWRAMPIQQMEREYYVLQATARKSKSLKQQTALEYQVKELEHELARARGRGLQQMEKSAQEGIDPTQRPQPAGPPPSSASEYASMGSAQLAASLGADPEYSAWAHRRFTEILYSIEQREAQEYTARLLGS